MELPATRSPPRARACAIARTFILPKRPERGAEFLGEELRLLPGGEVAALVDLVVIDEVGIGRSVQLRGA